ncbi:MAG: T9SS type A sorting domain-containing protein, partial [Bacteroidetes bacterium]|nr:T9SS type A sorting domain-containing protein [Bacteroidota bacterium]
YFWFTSQKDYIFHTSESGGVGSWAQYLVKVNKLGVIQWIQSFSAQSNSVYDLPILSYCLLGDDLFLNGQASTSCELGNLTTKETGEFLCKVNKNSGEVIIANFFKQDIINGSIISINNKILLNEQNLFYLFDTTCNNIKIQTINNFTSSYLIQNGNNHFIAIQKLFLTSTIKGMMLDNNDSVSELWTKTFNYAINSLFTTDNFIYFNLENDTIYQIDQFGRFHNKRYREPYQGYICGSNNLEYGYTYGIHKQPGGDTLILDTIHFCTGLLMPIGIDTVQPIISKSNGQFKAFPNPTEKLLTISMDNNISGDLELYNSLGILLKRIQIIDNLKEYTLDLSSYPSGCYLIHLQSNSNSHTMKILKQN